MKNPLTAMVAILVTLALAACGGASTQTDGSTSNAGQLTPSAAATQAAGRAALNESYKDALPVAAQLILGSLKLSTDETANSTQELAIDTGEAEQLLPLWQAYQSLSNSDNTAPAELQALIDQLQGTMRPEQVQAIAAMQLTADDIGEVMQALGPGSFGGGFDRRGGDAGNSAGAGGLTGPPPGDFFGAPGGMPGGGPGGGMPGGAANASPELQATALAERLVQDGGQAATFMTRGLLNQLITSLQLKTGDLTQAELQAQQQQRAAMRWLPLVSETTGIAAEDLNAALTGGASLAEVIKEKGGDLAAVEAALREALQSNPDLGEQAINDQITAVLNAKAPVP